MPITSAAADSRPPGSGSRNASLNVTVGDSNVVPLRNPGNHAKESREAQAWLEWLGEMLADARWLALFDATQSGHQIAKWPLDSVLPHGMGVFAHHVQQRNAVVETEIGKPAEIRVLGIPLDLSDARHKGWVLLIATSGVTQAQRQTLIQLSRWASVWLKPHIAAPIKQATADATKNPVGSVSDGLAQLLVESLASEQNEIALAFTLVNTMANRFDCERVSIGKMHLKQARILAVSGQSQVDHDRDIVQQMSAAMSEASANACTVCYPSQTEITVVAHATLFVRHGQHAMLTVRSPSHTDDQVVMLFERKRTEPFSSTEQAAIEAELVPLSSLFAILARLDETRLGRYKRQIVRWRQVVEQRQFPTSALLACGAALLLLIASLLPVSHRITARASIEAADRQVLVAPQFGHVKSAHARAGDYVTRGQLLASLDGSNLILEAGKWRSERLKNQQEYTAALANHDRTEMSRLRAVLTGIEAELSLVEQQLLRSELRAPFDGVILAGDLTQSLGAPVQQGDVLFEIGSADQFRLLLDIDESDIGYIVPGQNATLRMAAMPSQVWQAAIDAVWPVAIADKGSNVFRLPAQLQGVSTSLRPGMQGIGKIRVGSRSLLWTYTHRLTDRLRLMAWRLGLLR